MNSIQVLRITSRNNRYPDWPAGAGSEKRNGGATVPGNL
jgi:hypothetical protein